MFGYLIVYAAALLLGFLAGLAIPSKSFRWQIVTGATAGALAGIFAVWEARPYDYDGFPVSTYLLEFVLPAAESVLHSR
jgi:hypothetical protein